jgi:hypothetical protein
MNTKFLETTKESEPTMPTAQSRLIPVTDAQGRMLLQGEDQVEPLPGSVVLTAGYHGTAWQRHFADGLWYSTMHGHHRSGYTWKQIVTRRNVVLVYDAEGREE